MYFVSVSFADLCSQSFESRDSENLFALCFDSAHTQVILVAYERVKLPITVLTYLSSVVGFTLVLIPLPLIPPALLSTLCCIVYGTFPAMIYWMLVLFGRLNPRTLRQMLTRFDYVFPLVQLVLLCVCICSLYETSLQFMLSLCNYSLMMLALLSLDAATSSTRRRMLLALLTAALLSILQAVLWYFHLLGRHEQRVVYELGFTRVSLELSSFFANRIFTFSMFLFRAAITQLLYPSRLSTGSIAMSKQLLMQQMTASGRVRSGPRVAIVV
jgi:hypothetical protein